mmetsp:Transcript_602/g.1150  ORF Transcript_602/g.1150 Transcript_602/m.1150 type:complete len:83 (-) Transcript_602:17-265(-)
MVNIFLRAGLRLEMKSSYAFWFASVSRNRHVFLDGIGSAAGAATADGKRFRARMVLREDEVTRERIIMAVVEYVRAAYFVSV